MDVYEIVTNKILEMLEGGHIPWRKPWKSTEGAKNLITRKAYKGVNQILLNCSQYSSPYWLTFRQIKEKGGWLKAGSKANIVVFYKWINTTDTPTSEELSQDTPPSIKKYSILKYYNVFNLDQVEGIKPLAPEIIVSPFTAIERAEIIVDQMPSRPGIIHGGDKAAYLPSLDQVYMPPRERFTSPESYYACLWHELSHATGHHTRLNRKGITDPIRFGSHSYSQEELVAEFSSAMLCAHTCIEQETITNSAAYIQNWLKALRDDKKLAIIAAGQAQKACDHILNIKEGSEPEITD